MKEMEEKLKIKWQYFLYTYYVHIGHTNTLTRCVTLLQKYYQKFCIIITFQMLQTKTNKGLVRLSILPKSLSQQLVGMRQQGAREEWATRE